jgi:ribosome biogenesis GTPase A
MIEAQETIEYHYRVFFEKFLEDLSIPEKDGIRNKFNDYREGIIKQYEVLKDMEYELMVIGNTNVGKSTFLNNLTKMKDCFKTSVNRETSCIWRFKVVPDHAQDAPY